MNEATIGPAAPFGAAFPVMAERPQAGRSAFSGIATVAERWRAVLFVGFIVLLLALAWSTRTIGLGPSAAFFGLYGGLLVATEFLTALVLFVRAGERGNSHVTILAAAYAFTIPLIVANVSTLHGITTLVVPLQTPPLLWSFWHLGWSGLICAYAWSGARRCPRRWPVAAAVVSSLVCVLLSIDAVRWLPVLIEPDGTWTLPLKLVCASAFTLDVLTLVAFGRRMRRLSDLELCVLISVIAACGEVFIVANSNVRYSVGFYVGRIFSVVSGITVFGSIAGTYLGSLRSAAVLEQRVELAHVSAQHEMQFRALGDAVPMILWTASADGSIDWYNQRWYEYTGQTPAEAAGWGWQAVHHPDDFPEVMRRWGSSIARGDNFDMQFRMRSAGGAFRWFLCRVQPYRDDSGVVVRWFGTTTDIDEQRRDVERTRRLALMMQDVFLPATLPQHDRVVLDATYWAAESDAVVGGDWYDAFELPDGRMLLSIGDVAGHGLNAAIVAGRLRQSIFVQSLEAREPHVVLAMADRVLRAQSDVMATALLGFFDPRDGTLRYASAGHPAPVVLSNGRARIATTISGAPLGTGFATGGSLAVETQMVSLAPEDIVAFYTDGVTEFTRDIDAGEERLLRALEEIARETPALRAQSILERVFNGLAPTDDVALMVMRWGEGGGAAPARPATLTKQWRFHSSHALSARAARLELTEFLRVLAVPESDLFNVELIMGELLANTVEHAPGMVEVLIDWTGTRPLLRLRDSGPGFEPGESALPVDPMAEDGRGLFLVRTFAERFDIRPAPGFGTEFSVVLPLLR